MSILPARSFFIAPGFLIDPDHGCHGPKQLQEGLGLEVVLPYKGKWQEKAVLEKGNCVGQLQILGSCC